MCARLTSPGRGMPLPPPDQAGVGDGVVRRAERTLAPPGPRRCGRIPATLWICVVSSASANVRAGQNGRQALGQHGLARAGRPDHEHVVPARGGHFERALGGGLPAHVAEVQAGRVSGSAAAGAPRCDRRELLRLVEQRHHFGQVLHPEHAHAFHHRRLGRVLGRHHEVGDPRSPRADGHRERAAHRADAAVERQLAREQVSSARRTIPIAPRMPRAIGRSKPAPSLRTLAGARLMVTDLLG